MNENKLNFIYSLTEYLISDGQFSPVQSENGELHLGSNVNYLAKDIQGSPIIIGLIDGDSFSENQLSEIFEKDTGILNNINSRNAYVFEILLFNSSPSAEMLDIIEKGQADFPDEKRFLKCISINIAEKHIQKHYSVPNYDAGIEKSVRRFFLKGFDQRQCTAQDVANSMAKRKKDLEFTFAAEKPFVTYTLIAINLLVFALISLISTKSGKTYSEYLTPLGAKVNSLILQGEYWRFITPMFLHSDIVHVGVNCYSLYIIGSLIERLFGHAKFTFVYFVSGLLGCIASFAFSLNPSVGASGAIFGIFGAMLFFGLRRPALMKSSFGINLITTIIINLVYGFMNKNIDNTAHIGGLIGGVISSGAVYNIAEGKKGRLTKLVSLLLLIAVTIGGLFYGFNNKQNVLVADVNQLQEYFSQKNWSECEKLGEKILNLNPDNTDIKAIALWDTAQAETNQNKYDQGVEHAKELVKVSPVDGHYLLGRLYYDLEEYQASKEELTQAKQLNAPYPNIDSLYVSIQ